MTYTVFKFLHDIFKSFLIFFVLEFKLNTPNFRSNRKMQINHNLHWAVRNKKT